MVWHSQEIKNVNQLGVSGIQYSSSGIFLLHEYNQLSNLYENHKRGSSKMDASFAIKLLDFI